MYSVVLSTISFTSMPFVGIIATGVDYAKATQVMLGVLNNPSEEIKSLAPYKVQIIEKKE